MIQRLAAWRFVAAQLVAFGVGLWLTIPAEVVKFRAALSTKIGLWAWFYLTDVDTTFPFVLLLVAPVLWFVRRSPSTSAPVAERGRAVFLRQPARGRRDSSPNASDDKSNLRRSIDLPAWAMAVACALVSIGASARVASYEFVIEENKPSARFGDLPPAIHDESSYLFQAKTFLAGRLSFPSSARMPELFDQMHVLNEGRFASRYFPGVGLWLAPFVAIGQPARGEWAASALAAFFIFWAGRELGGNLVGLAAGLLTALSPGMALFANLILSHEPTMAGLSLFLFAFLRLLRTGRISDAFVAGCGLAFAMLCRPLTAAAFAFPFGLYFVCRFLQARGTRSLLACAALAAPLVFGLASLFFYDKAITGSGFVTPYQLYTDIYTPRHVYGFNNVARGERRAGLKVMDVYDRWANNLTPQLAVENVATRTLASTQWTLGPVPLAMAAVVFLLAALWQMDARWWLVGASVVAVHAAYIPYWLAGIMNWHYVFETGPLLLLLFAGTSQALVSWWNERRQVFMSAWWGTLVAASLLINWISFDPFWPSRVDAGVDELARARLQHARFEALLKRSVVKLPALVLIEADPRDIHTDYVINDPDLTAPLLRARYRPGKTDVKQVRAAFPDRALYLYRAASGQLTDLSP